MYNSTLMEVFQAQDHLSDIVLRPLFWQGTYGLDESCTIATIEVFHDQVQILLALKREVQFRHEGRLRLVHEDHPFSLDIRDLILRNHVRFPQHLDCKVITSIALLG